MQNFRKANAGPPDTMYPSGAGNALFRKWNSKFWTWNHLKKIYFIPVLATILTTAISVWLTDSPYSPRKDTILITLTFINIIARIAIIIAPVTIFLTEFEDKYWDSVKLTGLSKLEYSRVLIRYFLLNACLPYTVINYLWGIEFAQLTSQDPEYYELGLHVSFIVAVALMGFTQVMLTIWFTKSFRTMLALVAGASLLQFLGVFTIMFFNAHAGFAPVDFVLFYAFPEFWLGGGHWQAFNYVIKITTLLFGYGFIALIVASGFFNRLDLPSQKAQVPDGS